MRRTVHSLLLSLTLLGLPLLAQTTEVVSGNGQIVLEYFKTDKPLTVRVRDQFGRPIPNVPVNWSISADQGTLREPTNTGIGSNQIRSISDANGIVQVDFTATAVDAGRSIRQTTVLAQSPYGSVSLYVTTLISRLQGGGGSGTLPLVELVKPSLEDSNRTISGEANSTQTGAIVVRVNVGIGPETGSAMANVGVRIVDATDPALTPAGVCGGVNGMILTDSSGVATCNVTLASTIGVFTVKALVGEAVLTPDITLNIRTAVPCTFGLPVATRSYGSNGGPDTFALSASSTSCAWTAVSNASWLVVGANSASGVGSSSIAFTVQPNTGAARQGRITAGGQTFVVSQAAAGSAGQLTISSPAILPNAVSGQSYLYIMQGTGGSQPYIWQADSRLPPELTLTSDGRLSGIMNRTGNFVFSVLLKSGTDFFIREFTLTVAAGSQNSGGLAITNVSFPNATIGTPYRQVITSVNACPNFPSGPQYSLLSGALPRDLTVHQAGQDWVIEGTPNEVGSFNFTVQISDPQCGRTASKAFTLTVAGTQTGGGGTAGPISAAPLVVSFSVFAGTTVSPADQPITIQSLGQPLNYTATSFANWVLLRSGSQGSTPGTLFVGLGDIRDFAPGNYSSQIQISAPGAVSVPIQVNLEIKSVFSQVLTYNPPLLTFNVSQSFFPVNNPATQTISVTQPTGTSINIGQRYVGGSLNQQWLRVTPTSTVVPATINVVVNQQSLSPGVYRAEILLTPAGAVTATIIPVAMTVNNPPQLTWSTQVVSFGVSAVDPSPRPQQVTVLSTSSQVPVTVTSPTLSGGNWLSVAPNTGFTPLNLTINVNSAGLRPGQYEGQIIARASDSSGLLSQLRVTLAVTDTTPTITAVVHAANEVPGPLAPGSWAVVKGSFLGSSPDATPFHVTDGKVDTTLSDVRFLVDGFPVPVISASATKAVIQMPYTIANHNLVSVVAEYRGNRSDAFFVQTILINPAIFLAEGNQGRILNPDGSQNRLGNGASPGDIVTIFATGEGLTDPAGVDGLIAGDNPPKPVLLPVMCWMDGQEAEIISFGGVPGQPAGYFQVSARVPPTVTRGAAVNLTVGIAGNYTPDLVTVAITPPPNQ